MQTVRGWASQVVDDGGLVVELILESGGTQEFEVANEEAVAGYMDAFNDGLVRLFDLDGDGRIVAVRPDPAA